MSVFTCSIGFYNVEIELNVGYVLTFSILYTPVTIHVVDELGSLEILDIDPLITSSVGFMGVIECIVYRIDSNTNNNNNNKRRNNYN